MLHTLGNVNDAEKKHCPTQAMPLSLHGPENSSIARLQVRFISNFTFITK